MLLAFGNPEVMATSAAPEQQSDISPQSEINLIRPSKGEFNRIMGIRSANQSPDASLFSSAFPSPEKLSAFGNADVTLMATTGSLKERETKGQELSGSKPDAQIGLQGNLAAINSFNSTEFMGSTAFVRIVDNGLPGPEYEVPRADMLKAKPWGEAGMVWESIYERFRSNRMEVCGLELDMIPEKEL